ncbi:PREDICTED: transcription factor ORG2 [Tarenaya hassleriana]|uniref:transcription factor ORG2 n=1 Tax=Tarenaya hassleriana TaxID=28532 RepID=UPI00053C3EBE|nr:PREDICTED: transcription factor ORG2 [Tarenaya hassleriana]
MCALVPPLFADFGWPSEEQIYGGGYINAGEFLEFPASLGLSNSSEGDGKSNGRAVAKKMNHNASERDRRKKINALFSSLRSLLPPSDCSKKLSIPATVSHALKYIPELVEQIKKLLQKKEELMVRLSGQRDLLCENDKDDEKKSEPTKATGFGSIVTVARINETEAVVQISSLKAHKCSFPNVLRGLEEDGFVIIDASSSLSRGDRLFYTVHFQAEAHHKLSCGDLRDKLLSLICMRDVWKSV